ncbi:MAG: DUF6131 family protein, partial [Acidimicrobiales bacterium]
TGRSPEVESTRQRELVGLPRPAVGENRYERMLEETMIVVGIALLVIGFIAAIPILWTLGVVVLVIGLVLMLMGAVGRQVGGRKHYF